MIRKVIDLLRDMTSPDKGRHWSVPCFAGAMMAAVGWLTIDRVRLLDHPGGFFAPLGWPVSSLAICVVIGAVIGLVCGWFERTWRQRHADGIRAAAEQMGCEYSSTAEVLRGFASRFPMLRDWHHSDHLMTTKRDGVDVQVFDLTTEWRGGDSAISHTTIVLLPAEGVPDFDIAPRSFLMFGTGKWSGLQFDASDSMTSADAAAMAEFSRRCVVYCGYTRDDSEMKSLQPAPEAEQAVRNLLTPIVMQALTPLAEWWIESRDGRLALSRGRGFRPPTERAEMIDQAVAIRSVMIGNRE